MRFIYKVIIIQSLRLLKALYTSSSPGRTVHSNLILTSLGSRSMLEINAATLVTKEAISKSACNAKTKK